MIIRLLFIAILFICSSKAYDSDDSSSNESSFDVTDSQSTIDELRRKIIALDEKVDRLEEQSLKDQVMIRQLTKQLHKIHVMHNQCPEKIKIEDAKDFKTKKEGFKEEMLFSQQVIDRLIVIKFKKI